MEWLNSVGVTGILLKYRVPARKGRPRHEAPLQDAQRAMGIVRQRAAALFIPFASPNVIATVYDITLPEVRSTALSIQYFIEDGGAAIAPLLAGFIARSYSLQTAILVICVTAWIFGAIFLAFTADLVPRDIQTLRAQMRERAVRARKAAHPLSMPYPSNANILL